LAGATDRGICLLEFTERRILEALFATMSDYQPSAVGRLRYKMKKFNLR
jgi:hypothetical protein